MPIYKKFNTIVLNKSQRENLLEIRDLENLEFYKNYVFPRDFQTEDFEVYEHVFIPRDHLSFYRSVVR